MRVRVCVYTHTHTHTYIHTYIYQLDQSREGGHLPPKSGNFVFRQVEVPQERRRCGKSVGQSPKGVRLQHAHLHVWETGKTRVCAVIRVHACVRARCASSSQSILPIFRKDIRDTWPRYSMTQIHAHAGEHLQPGHGENLRQHHAQLPAVAHMTRPRCGTVSAAATAASVRPAADMKRGAGLRLVTVAARG